ncbi:hypothetical protein PIB30_052893 [Stylosanthes scabra]|uniref:Replication factor A C-terminal domain-containing protein n=1 Tax=Stylosanthes scabra TaxID=79078 RepID=A0ABU6RIN5_9FABA|nr:hypothetical protein [Stylosanthes scabra]
MGNEAGRPSRVVQIEKKAPYSMDDDFLNNTTYKTISEIKDLIEKRICVTVGIVKDFTSGKSWWYKGCNNCPNAVKEERNTYKCPNCQWKAATFTPKYALNLKVADEDSCASFIMYETVGSDYLNISASDLRTKYIMRGGNKNEFPVELDKFKDMTFFFKVSVKLENLNSFQPISIIVMKLCHDDSIINSFIKKYNLEQEICN